MKNKPKGWRASLHLHPDIISYRVRIIGKEKVHQLVGLQQPEQGRREILTNALKRWKKERNNETQEHS